MSCCNPQTGTPSFTYEGAFASNPLAQNLEIRAPFASALAGPGAPVSNTPGTIQGRFGWLSQSGVVNNTRVAASDRIGFVVPLRSLNGANGGVVGGPRAIAGGQASRNWEFWDLSVTPPVLRVRPGLAVTLHARGNFWCRFAGGGVPGNIVYASLVDGSAISGPADNAEATLWAVTTVTQPGALGIISTTAFFTP